MALQLLHVWMKWRGNDFELGTRWIFHKFPIDAWELYFFPVKRHWWDVFFAFGYLRLRQLPGTRWRIWVSPCWRRHLRCRGDLGAEITKSVVDRCWWPLFFGQAQALEGSAAVTQGGSGPSKVGRGIQPIAPAKKKLGMLHLLLVIISVGFASEASGDTLNAAS